MALRRVDLRPAAIRDLIGIVGYIIDTHGLPLSAQSYVDRIERRCLELAILPFVGRSRDDLAPGTRTLPFEGVLVIYRGLDDRIVVDRIVGQHQRIDPTLLR